MGQPETATMTEAIARTGYTKRMLHLRIDAWLAGREDPYAIVGWRAHPTAPRCAHPRDLERVARQKAGRLDHWVTPHAYALAEGYAADIRPPAAGWREWAREHGYTGDLPLE